MGVAGTPYSSLAGVFIILKPGVDGIGVGVANRRRDGVRIGAYPTGASRIRYLLLFVLFEVKEGGREGGTGIGTGTL